MQNAEDFAKAAAQLVPSTTIILISKSSLQHEINEKAPFQTVIRVPGLSKMHVIQSKSGIIKLWKKAGYVKDAADITIAVKNEMSANDIQEQSFTTMSLEFKIGDWVAVKYDGKLYPGEVAHVLTCEIVVSTMHA